MPSEEVKISRIAETILGILGGIFGLVGSLFALTAGGLAGALGAEGASMVVGLGLLAILLSILGIVGGAISSRNSKVAGILMLVAGIGGFIAVFLAYIVAAPLLVTGGILSLVRKGKDEPHNSIESREGPQKHQKKGFKKLLLILGGVLVFLVIIGALAGSPDETPTEESPAIYSVNQDVTVGDVQWKLLSAKNRGSVLKASESRYYSPSFNIAEAKKTTGKFIQIKMEVENLGKDLKSVTSLTLVDDQGREFTSASDVSEWIPEDKELFLFDNLNPNIPTQFVDIYEVPSDAKGFKVKVGDLDVFGSGEALIELGF